MNDTLQDISERETKTDIDVIQHIEDTVTAGIPENNRGGPVIMSAGQHKQITHTVVDCTQNQSFIMEKP